MQKSSYYLSRHVFFCLADDHYVFLDLRSDEYLCLGRTQTDEFRELLNRDLPNSRRRFDERSTVVQSLLEKGLFVDNEALGKRPAAQHIEAAAASLMAGLDNPRRGIDPAHACKFFAAAAAASWHLCRQSIEHTVRQVERRKLVNRNSFAAADHATIVDLFAIFQALRPYYPRPYLCLFDSLALIHFLARFGVFPQWVYGVKLEPWGAHCWVQAGDRIVNDIVDNVNGYTPIMSI